LLTLGVLAVVAIAFFIFAGFWTDWLWYRSVDYSSVFTTLMWTKVGLFLVFGLLMTLAVGLNIYLAHRLRPPLSAMSVEQQSLDRYRMAIAPYKRWLLLGISSLVGLIAGASASGQWRTWLQWVNSTSFGVKDPEFKKDVSFYAFDLPWYRFLLSFGFAATVLCLLAAAAVHYLYGGLRVTSPGARATSAATGHLSVLLGVFVSLKAVAYWLDRYALAVKSSGFKATDGWTGLRYVDANAYLPAKTILFCIAVVCAILFFVTLWRRTWSLPMIGFGLMVLSAILIGGLYPAIVQKFQVQPNEQAKEAPYIAKNIKATREAYGIQDTQVDPYSGESKASNEELRGAADTTAALRLLDPAVVSDTYEQLQQVRGYYQFPQTLDVDRYTIDGKQKDTVIGLRELDLAGIPKSNWVNDHFKYTHGYGVVSAEGTTTEANGEPKFTEKNLPPQGELGKYEPRIYFGEQTNQYSIVGGPTKEIDYADNSGEKDYTYKGKGGVSLDNPFTRAAYAIEFNEPQIMYSGAIGEGSKILYDRTPKERVEAVAPWLTIDRDPYPAVVEGRIQWIVDGYTTTNGYPYASRTTLGDTTADSLTQAGQRELVSPENQVNYIRNSVKATVDAYDGTVKLYQWDTQDPVLKTWMKAFPGTVEKRSEISDELMEHLRYPQDLFKVQRELLTRYHVTDPETFFSGSEVWKVPADPTTGTETGPDVPPYYLSMKMPDQREQTFSLTSTFVPNRRENLASFMAVDADASSPGYGTIRLLKLPSSSTVDGPKLVQSKFNSKPAIADQINIWKRGDSEVQYGNLLTVPLEGGLLYVEPVYVRGAGAKFPLLKKVLVTYGEETAFEDNLEKALNVVFGVDSPTPPSPDEGDQGDENDQDPNRPSEPDTSDPTVRKALQDAQEAFEDGQEAIRDGDWGAYGEAQKELEEALQRAQDAEQRQSADQGDGRGGENQGRQENEDQQNQQDQQNRQEQQGRQEQRSE
jgi:uncharacterized membrane protein (UPF0182 family)